MSGEKSPSIAWEDFQRWVPNGSWVRWRVGAPHIIDPVEGVVIQNNVDNRLSPIQEDSILHVTSTIATDPVILRAGRVEYKVGENPDDWIDFTELCIRATEQRLQEARGTATDTHPLAWMTHKDELNMSVEQIGTQLYDVATWIEAQGNRGYSHDELMIALPALKIRVLGKAYRPAWQDIVFFGDGDHRRDYQGWGVHKYNPAHWTRTWLERFGLAHPKADELTTAIWDEALAEYAKRSIKRKHATYAGIDLEMEATRSIAHKAAAFDLLATWAQQRSWSHWGAREVWRMQARLYDDAASVFAHELVYRLDQQPQKRRSKKQTQLARDDWATAALYLDNHAHLNVHYFFTEAYIRACCETDVCPDTSVDFDALPRDVQGEVQA